MRNGSIKKYIAFLAVVLILVLSAGCSSAAESHNEMNVRKLVIGSDTYEPYIYRNDEGEYVGIDIEIATEALHRMGYEPEFKSIVWENKKKLLADGEVDCLWGCFSMNGREDEYQWCGPYLYSCYMIAVRMYSNIYKLSDLDGKLIAVQETSKAEEYFLHTDTTADGEKIPDVRLVYCFSEMDEVFAALRKNYVEAICGHENALKTFINTAPDKYRLLEEHLLDTQLGVAFDKGYDKEFVLKLGETLNTMMDDGTIAGIVEKYGLDVDKAIGRRKD